MKELELINRVELKLLLADTDSKLSAALGLYLAPLILKLGSGDAEVRQRVMSILQHVSRTMGPDVTLPVTSLISQFVDPKIRDKTVVRTVGLEFLRKSFKGGQITVDIFPASLCGISVANIDLSALQCSTAMMALPSMVKTWKNGGSAAAVAGPDLHIFAEKCAKLFLLDLKYTERGSCPGLSREEYGFYVNSGSLLADANSLSQAKSAILSMVELFLAGNKQCRGTVDFTDSDVQFLLIVASGDQFIDVADKAAGLLKGSAAAQEPTITSSLFELALGGISKMPAGNPMQIRILETLAKLSPEEANKHDLVSLIRLAFSNGDIKVTSAAVSLIRTLVTATLSKDTHLSSSDQLIAELKTAITKDGWPRYAGGQEPEKAKKVRSRLYETIGLLLRLTPNSYQETVEFLLRSLENEDTDVIRGIQDAFIEALMPAYCLPDASLQTLANSLLQTTLGSQREATIYAAVRCAVKFFPFDNCIARLICLLAIGPDYRSDIIEEGRRGLDAQYFTRNSAQKDARFPALQDMVNLLNRYKTSLDSTEMAAAAYFLFQCFVFSFSNMDLKKDFQSSFSTNVQVDDSLRQLISENLATHSDALQFMVGSCFKGMINGNDKCELAWKVLLETSTRSTRLEFSRYTSELFSVLPTISDGNLLIPMSLATVARDEDIESLIIQTRELEFSNKNLTLSLLLARQAADGLPIEPGMVSLVVGSSLDLEEPAPLLELAKAGLLSDQDSQPITAWLEKCSTETCILALGALAISYPTKRADFLELLLAMVPKDLNLLLANGEAITLCLAGRHSSAFKSVFRYASEESVDRELLKATLKSTLNDTTSSNPATRRASCLRILCIIQFCKPFVTHWLFDIQRALMLLLADSDELTQESASRGLGVLFEGADESVKNLLVDQLLSSFTGDRASKPASKIQPDTELFQPGNLVTNEGSITTYKDILDLASEVGDSSLVYKFMSLASNSQLWGTRRGMAFGLESVMAQANLDSLLGDSDSKKSKLLVSKLYRYRFDPNTKVQQAMRDLWEKIVPNPGKTIKLYLDDIVDELFKGCNSREWRVRQASALGLADLVRTVERKRLSGHMIDLWQIAFRCMDDIMESVRVSGLELAKLLASSVEHWLRADESLDSEPLALLVPFLFGPKGIYSKSEDVSAFALTTAMKLSALQSAALRPHRLYFVEQLVLLATTVEPQTMNYLVLNSANHGLDQYMVNDARARSFQRSPFIEALNNLLEALDVDQLRQLLIATPNLVKSSVGLPSKIAAAQLISKTCSKFVSDIDRSFLLPTCKSQLWDRVEVVGEAYAVAAAHICRMAKSQSVEQYIGYLSEAYFTQGLETKHAAAIAIAIESLSKHASDVFTSYEATLLPLVFVGLFDANEQVSALFKEIWEANSTSTSSVRLYSTEIIDASIPLVFSSSWSQRKTAAQALRAVADVTGVRPGQQLQRLNEGLGGRYWPGKEILYEASVKFSCAGHLCGSDFNATSMEEIRKANRDYRIAILPWIGKLLGSFPNQGLFDLFFEQVDTLLHATDTKALSIDDKTKIFGGAVEAFHPGFDVESKMEHVFPVMLEEWKLQLPALKAMGELGEKGYFSRDIWDIGLAKCACSGHEAVRVEWVRSAAKLTRFGITEDVERVTEAENSSIVLAELSRLGLGKTAK